MINTLDIRDKEVINIYDGKSMGFVDDIEIDLQRGTVEGIVVPAARRMLSFFGREEDYVVRWKDVKRVGEDVILVDVPGGNSLHGPFNTVYNEDVEETP